MEKQKYVLKAIDYLGKYDGYYTGNNYIYQGSKYAVVESDKTKAKIYMSEARAKKSSEMSFENYILEVEKLT